MEQQSGVEEEAQEGLVGVGADVDADVATVGEGIVAAAAQCAVRCDWERSGQSRPLSWDKWPGRVD